jgi:SAM-dependent methyltransferase
VSKRDDDPQSDMEVGMTTAERRRRRRRGGGLRVPSDNVPRRSTTPPVVAPVPEDPSLAMSIAYSFTAEASDAVPRATHDAPVPSFENHEAMPTVIDPVSGPVEQADFEMQTREMTAVDLEELGLSDAGGSGSTLPVARISSPAIELPATMPAIPGSAPEAPERDATDPDDEVEVEIDSRMEAVGDAGTTLDQEEEEAEPEDMEPEDAEPEPEDATADLSEVDSAELSALESSARPSVAEPAPARPAAEALARPQVASSTPTAPAAAPPVTPLAIGEARSRGVGTPTALPAGRGSSPVESTAYKGVRFPTLALSEEDLEEVREAARLAETERSPEHRAKPEAPDQRSEGSAEFDVRGGRMKYGVLATQPPTRPGSMSIPPPMPSTKPAEIKPRPVESPSAPETKPRPAELPSVPEIDIMALEDKATDASGEFEVDVDGIVETKPEPIDPTGEDPRPAGKAVGVPTPRDRAVPIAASPAPAAAPEPRTRQPSPPTGYAHPPSNLPASQSTPPPGSPPGPPPATSSRESQPIPTVRDPQHASPPPPPVAHKAPPSPPPAAKKDKAPAPAIAPPSAPSTASTASAASAANAASSKPDGKPGRGKPWFLDLFDEDYLRTLPFLTPQATQAEAEFVINAMGLSPGAQVLDVGCGYGRHAMELAARGFHVVGLDISTPLLLRGGEEAHRRGLTINFVRGDMREIDFDSQFDGAYCLFSTFGYFDDEANKKTVANIARALKPGGRVLLEILNRDYVIADLPTRVWWEGDGCVVLEEVELNYFSSRIQVSRSVVFDDGRQLEQDISVRAYALHEVGKLLHAAGLRVLEVSGAYHTRGRFFGNQSRHIIVLAERKDPNAT